MAAHPQYESMLPLEGMPADMTHAIKRWDSHEMSPRQPHSTKPTQSSATRPFAQRQDSAHRKETRRPRPRGPGRFGSQSTMSSVAAGEQDESCDEEIVTHHTGSEGHEQAVQSLTQSTIPSQRLALGKNGEDIEEIGQWYFVCQLPERDYEYFKSVQENWVKDIWDMGRNSEPIFSVLGAFALHKKALLGGSAAKPEYYEQKGQIIKSIVSDISQSPSGPDPITVVAMAILAYLDIRDDQLDASGTHLRAVSRFIDMPSIPTQGWLYCTWIDLRQALFTTKEPLLPFYIPVPFREVPATLQGYQREAFRLGALNASECPRSPVFTLDMASDLFGKLHALCHCPEIPPSSETPPFGQVYALEYGLRVVQARAKQNEIDVLTAPIMLITSAIQLHVWMAARFYTPQARETHLGLIRLACKIIDEFDDMISQWYIAAGLESLLWVLFTLVATLHAHELPQTTGLLGLLYKALRKAGIYTCEDMEARLRRWPWLDNWHPVQIDTVWELLCARFPDLVPRIAPLRNVTGTTQDPNKARHRWFLGGLEFYNSL